MEERKNMILFWESAELRVSDLARGMLLDILMAS
jgi:hypothetical protein